ANPERGAAMSAELIDQRIAPLRVAPAEQPLGQKLHPHRRALVLRQLAREQCRQPVAAEQPAHRGAGTGLGGIIVLFFSEHDVTLWSRPDATWRDGARGPGSRARTCRQRPGSR